MSFFDNPQDEVDYYKSEYFNGFHSNSFTIIVCVENGDDEPFWRFVINELENSSIKPAFLYLDGKENIKKYINCFDKEFIGCVDSDYDYILEKEYLEKKFIFHTYVYSIENYCSCAKTVESLLNSLNVCVNFNFIDFFEKMSELIKKVFYYDLYLKENNLETIRNVFKFTDITKDEISEQLILEKIENKITSLNLDIDEDMIEKYNQKITNDPYLNEKFLHLYIEGHLVYDSLVILLGFFIKNKFKSEIEEISNNPDYTGIQKKQKINELSNRQLDLNTSFKINYKECYYRSYCQSFNKIIEDMKVINS